MDGNGIPSHGHVIFNFGQLALYCWRKSRISMSSKSTTDSSGWFAGRPGTLEPSRASGDASRLDEHRGSHVKG
jgi:hypothetical protein